MLMSAERVGLALGESDLRAKIFSRNSKFFFRNFNKMKLNLSVRIYKVFYGGEGKKKGDHIYAARQLRNFVR